MVFYGSLFPRTLRLDWTLLRQGQVLSPVDRTFLRLNVSFLIVVIRLCLRPFVCCVIEVLHLRDCSCFPGFPELHLVFFVVYLFTSGVPNSEASYSDVSGTVLGSSEDSK